MAGLLVSVRSADEARAALEGGATIIDVKEPARGPLGRADASIWRAVRAVVPATIPVSVALGDMCEPFPPPSPRDLEGISYCKLGLAHSGLEWRSHWWKYREDLGPGGPSWIAVAYADWERADAPAPDEVLAEAVSVGCAGILLDTWDKTRRGPFSLQAPEVDDCARWIARARQDGLLVTLAGSLDEDAIRRFGPVKPDLFAVRGAACREGRREAIIDPARVTSLVAAARA